MAIVNQLRCLKLEGYRLLFGILENGILGEGEANLFFLQYKAVVPIPCLSYTEIVQNAEEEAV